MDSIIVFDSSNYPVLTKFGPLFIDCVAQVSAKHGLTTSQSKTGARKELESNQETLNNVLVMLFAPVAASIRILKSKAPSDCSLLNDIYSSARIVHSQYMDQLFLYIYDSSNSSLSIHRIKRQLEMFKEMSTFFFGVNLASAKRDPHQNQLLIAMFDHWLLNESNPNYLVEAIENLVLSGQLQSTFRRLLQCVVGKSREHLWAFDEQPCHALAFVYDKMFSSLTVRGARPLTKRNMLLLSTLAQTQRARWRTESCQASNGYSRINQDHTSQSDKEPIVCGYSGDDESNDHSDEEEPCHEVTIGHSRSCSHSINSCRRFSSQSKALTSSKDLNSSWPMNKRSKHKTRSRLKEAEPFTSQIVFMNGSECSHILLPFCVRIINLSDDLTLLLVAETRTMDLTAALHVLLEMLLTIQYSYKDLNGFVSLNKFERAVTKLKRNLKHTNSKKLIKSIEQLSSGEFRKWLLSFDSSELPTPIDALCASICGSLREFYHSCVYAHEVRRLDQVDSSKDILSQLDWIRIYCDERLAYYTPFLRVKSGRNLTLDPFIPDCPDLVAILYVDRVRNDFVYSISDDVLNHAGSNLYKTILPEAFKVAYEKVSSGSLQAKWTLDDHDLCVDYVMWFEDLTGQRLSPSTVPSFRVAQCPAMISKNFIQEIISKVFVDLDQDEIEQHGPIACYELLYIQKKSPDSRNCHSGTLARKLAARLWEITAVRMLDQN